MSSVKWFANGYFYHEISISDVSNGLSYLEYIHSKAVFEAIVGNEIAMRQEFVQLPYPAVSSFASEFPISNWMISALAKVFNDDFKNEQYNFLKLSQEDNPDYSDVGIFSAAIAAPKIVELQGINENQLFYKRREGVFAVKLFDRQYINDYGEVRKCKGQPRFATLVSVSTTKKIFCYHCTEHVTFCSHAELMKRDALPEIPELEQVKKNHRKLVRSSIADVIIPVPISITAIIVAM